MSNPFTSPMFNRGVTAPVPVMPRQDGSYPGGSVAALSMQPHSDPLPVETPTRAAPVTLTAPLTAPAKPANGPAHGANVGPSVPDHDAQIAQYAKDHPELVALNDVRQPNPPPKPAPNGSLAPAGQNPGTTAGREVVSPTNRKVADSPLIRLLSPLGR